MIVALKISDKKQSIEILSMKTKARKETMTQVYGRVQPPLINEAAAADCMSW